VTSLEQTKLVSSSHITLAAAYLGDANSHRALIHNLTLSIAAGAHACGAHGVVTIGGCAVVAVGGGASSVLRDSQQAGSRQTESWVSETLNAVLLSDLTRYLERLVVVEPLHLS
jgi:hypothetical protein